MFLRQKIRKKDGKTHRSWSVVESRHATGGRVFQHQLLHLGELNDAPQHAAPGPPIASACQRCASAWTASACGGRASGAPVGWRSGFGRNCDWTRSGRPAPATRQHMENPVNGDSRVSSRRHNGGRAFGGSGYGSDGSGVALPTQGRMSSGHGLSRRWASVPPLAYRKRSCLRETL